MWLGIMLLAIGAPGADQSAPSVERDARAVCGQRWPDDFALQAACVRNARDGAASWDEIRKRYRDNPAMGRALEGCVKRHTKDGLINWALVGGCARNQEQGLINLTP